MSGISFYQRVQSHPHLQYLGVSGNEVIIKNTQKGSRFALCVDAILTGEWDELEAVLMGTRPPQIMTHVTRIVGYYSQLNNWNKSKIAELADRHKGDYSVN